MNHHSLIIISIKDIDNAFFKMEKTISIQSTTWLDFLPTEILFLIFDYLSNNDIVYTFFDYNQRLNNLLLENERYLNYFEFPTINLNLWKSILLMIGSRIECLNIDLIDLSFPLIDFPKLKSLIISSSNELTNEEWKFIFESRQFSCLHSLKIQEKKINFNEFQNNHLTNSKYVLTNVLNPENCLEIFSCSLLIPSLSKKPMINFLSNLSLHSLTLILTDIEDLFVLIEYTPNLKYLNIKTRPSYQFRRFYEFPQSINKINFNLKEFHLQLGCRFPIQRRWICKPYIFDKMINNIKLFSSSLICFSLDITNVVFTSSYEFVSDSRKLQQFLESMKQLEQFHLYASIPTTNLNNQLFLSRFENEFWFKHNWSFGMYRNYLFTLPFYFNFLSNFSNDIQSNNSELLRTNHRLWYNVKSIELSMTNQYDIHFLRELKIKMPKLNFIKFNSWIQNSKLISNERINLTLNNVTTILFQGQYFQENIEWFIHLLPNLRHLILHLAKCPFKQSEILSKQIKELDILNFSTFILSNNEIYIYFSKLEYLNIWIEANEMNEKSIEEIIWKILNNFYHLKILTIYFYSKYSSNSNILNNLFHHLNIDQITNNYLINIQKNFLSLQKIFH
jgi:hypothetical protein